MRTSLPITNPSPTVTNGCVSRWGQDDRRGTLNNQALLLAFTKGYRADEHGVVRSPRGHVMSSRDKDYPRFSITVPGRCAVRVLVHRLIALQKYGEVIFEPGVVVRHKDGNPHNRHPDNVLIGTQQQNIMDMSPEQRHANGCAGGRTRRKLTTEQAREVVRLHRQGFTYHYLAAQFGLGKTTIEKICEGHSYPEAQEERAP